MCTKPIRIFNRSDYLNPTSRLMFDVPCGHCAECRKAKRLSHQLLLTAEFDSTIEHKGYAYFDTLTYADKYLPCLGGVSVFNRSQVSRFLKNVRESIVDEYIKLDGLSVSTKTRKTYRSVVKEKFKYFLVSEFGHDDLYVDSVGLVRKGTERPHYHVCWYVHDNRLTIDKLKEIVNKHWYFGFTDMKIKKHLVDSSRCLGLWSYFTKYVVKSVGDLKEYNKRIDKCNVYLDSKFASKSRYSETLSGIYVNLQKQIEPFYFRSQLFGLSQLNKQKDKYIKDQHIVYRTKKGFYKYSLPSNFIRKHLMDYDSEKQRYVKTDKYNDLLLARKEFVATQENNNTFAILKDDIKAKAVARYNLYIKDRPLTDCTESDIKALDVYSENNSIKSYLYSDDEHLKSVSRKQAKKTIQETSQAYSNIADSVSQFDYDSAVKRYNKEVKLLEKEKNVENSKKVFKKFGYYRK